ncbi:MAG: putative Ig domain-containing protein [Actinomycetota bacterium]
MSFSTPRTHRIGVALATTAVVFGAAAPAGAHHDPLELAATEAVAKALAQDTATGGGGGLPTSVIVGATMLVVGMLIGRVARRPRLPRATRRRALAVVSIGALVSVPLATAPANTATILLPDLISDQPDPVSLEVNTYTGTPRLVLRFDGYVTNVGDGPLEVSGNPQITNPSDPNGVHQRAIDTSGNWNIVGTPPVQYETADGHNHFHLMEVGRYSLWNQSQTAEVAPGQKVGFCLYDIERAEAEDWSGPHPPREYSGSVTQFCDSNNPNTTSLIMGTSEGWRDVYGAYLTFQWIDVSEVAPGIYYLANEADPFDRIVESDETNNQVGFSEVSSTIPGYNALPVGPVSTVEDTAVGVTLATESFGSPGSRRFEIVTPPSNGTLSQPTGTTFSSPTLTYTPDPGYSGPDSFEYVARDNSSNYPLNPTNAAASIDVGEVLDPSVEISGAPASVIAGTSANLTATVTDAPPGVDWSVDGAPGGNPIVGTISPGGLYVAPGTPPAAGSVTIRAALTGDPGVFDEITLGIDPIPNGAPDIIDPGDQSSTIGDAVNVAIGASDPNGDPFTFSATGLPDGLSIHPTTGVVSGTPTTTGTSTATVTADDGTDDASVTFDWTIDPRPTVTPQHVGVVEGDSGTTTATLEVHLTEAISQEVTADWVVLDGVAPVASIGTDIVADSGSISWAPGETVATLTVEIIGDTLAEPPVLWGEWALVSIRNVSANADLDTSFFGTSIAVIIDDD